MGRWTGHRPLPSFFGIFLSIEFSFHWLESFFFFKHFLHAGYLGNIFSKFFYIFK